MRIAFSMLPFVLLTHFSSATLLEQKQTPAPLPKVVTNKTPSAHPSEPIIPPIPVKPGDPIKPGQLLGCAEPLDPSRPEFLRSTFEKEFLKVELPALLRLYKVDIHFDVQNAGYEFELIYKGTSRPIARQAKELLRDFSPYYKEEIMVNEGQHEFWLPIQSDLWQFFKKEVKSGSRFTTKVRYFGVYNYQNNYVPVYGMIEFVAQ